MKAKKEFTPNIDQTALDRRLNGTAWYTVRGLAPSSTFRNFRVSRCSVQDTLFALCVLSGSEWRDCAFTKCDFTGAEVDGAKFVRCFFLDCGGVTNLDIEGGSVTWSEP